MIKTKKIFYKNYFSYFPYFCALYYDFFLTFISLKGYRANFKQLFIKQKQIKATFNCFTDFVRFSQQNPKQNGGWF